MKYRRKGEIVDATYHAVGLDTSEAVFKGPCYHYTHRDGHTIVYPVARFEREFERVSEKAASAPSWRGDPSVREYFAPDPDLRPAPGYIDLQAGASHFFREPDYGFCQNYRCAACGKGIGEDESFVVPAGHLEALCWKCYRKRYNTEKQPVPLTIADLKRGDVFRYRHDAVEGHLRCDEKHQMLADWVDTSDASRIFYCAGAGEFFKGDRSSSVRRIAHHDLTEKQRLWADATREMREALEKSISEKWLPIMRGEKRGHGACDCPMCRVSNSCSQCLCYRGSLQGCKESGGYASGYEIVMGPIAYDGARHFTLWLASFLPNIHPLRIEVEATPVEWPGKARDK